MQVGQHVVCIDDHFPMTQRDDRRFGVLYPVKGVVYTVREIEPHPVRAGENVVRLMELRNPKLRYQQNGISLGVREKAFRTNRFRPLKKLKVEDFVTEKQPETV